MHAMKILAYDTSSSILSLALLEDSRVIDQIHDVSFLRHSAMLVPLIKSLLKNNKTPLDTIDCLALGLGPGSFTGLRVGVATAQMIAYALKKKIVALSSFEVIARQAGDWPRGDVAVIQDARKNNLYTAVYRKKGTKTLAIEKPGLSKADDFFRKVSQDTLFTGEGVAQCMEKMIQLKKEKGCDFIDEKDKIIPWASTLGLIAYEKVLQKKYVKIEDLKPLYLYPRDCNVAKK